MIKDCSFFLPGERKGVLLIHGLTGTPTEMRIVGKGLNKAGYTVYGMQLAGHCGDVDDLCKTTWQDWYKSVEEAKDFLLEKVDTLFVAGLSMGALLSLKLAIDYPKQIKGVGVYGITLRYDGWSIPFGAKNFFFLLTWFKRFGLFQKAVFVEKPPYGLKDERIRAAVSADMLSGDSAAAGLASNPFPALAEMQLLASTVKKQLSRVVAPCIIIHSGDDDIANIDTNARIVEKNVSARTKMVVLDDSYHLVTIDRQRREVIHQTVDFFNKIIQHDSFTLNKENIQ